MVSGNCPTRHPTLTSDTRPPKERPMKITSVTPVPVSNDTPFGARNYMFVKVETDEGITGWGAATSGPYAVAADGRGVIGRERGARRGHCGNV